MPEGTYAKRRFFAPVSDLTARSIAANTATIDEDDIIYFMGILEAESEHQGGHAVDYDEDGVNGPELIRERRRPTVFHSGGAMNTPDADGTLYLYGWRKTDGTLLCWIGANGSKAANETRFRGNLNDDPSGTLTIFSFDEGEAIPTVTLTAST